jgi:hypothetical protein
LYKQFIEKAGLALVNNRIGKIQKKHDMQEIAGKLEQDNWVGQGRKKFLKIN